MNRRSILRLLGLAPLVPMGAIALKPSGSAPVAVTPEIPIYDVVASPEIPVYIKDGVLHLRTAQIGEAVIGQLQSANGKLAMDDKGITLFA